jgi:hypothetical protein
MTVFQLAKQIRRKNEPWQKAIQRAKIRYNKNKMTGGELTLEERKAEIARVALARARVHAQSMVPGYQPSSEIDQRPQRRSLSEADRARVEAVRARIAAEEARIAAEEAREQREEERERERVMDAWDGGQWKRGYYATLDVSTGASDAELKKAYHTLALRWHPDRNPGNKEEADKQFKLIAQAYGVLSNPSTRQMYDSGPWAWGMDYYSLGTQGGGRRSRKRAHNKKARSPGKRGSRNRRATSRKNRK